MLTFVQPPAAPEFMFVQCLATPSRDTPKMVSKERKSSCPTLLTHACCRGLRVKTQEPVLRIRIHREVDRFSCSGRHRLVGAHMLGTDHKIVFAKEAQE